MWVRPRSFPLLALVLVETTIRLTWMPLGRGWRSEVRLGGRVRCGGGLERSETATVGATGPQTSWDVHQTLVDMDLSYDRKRWMVIVSKGLFKNGDQRLLTLTGLLGQALTSCS